MVAAFTNTVASVPGDLASVALAGVDPILGQSAAGDAGLWQHVAVNGGAAGRHRFQAVALRAQFSF
jgi:hypothetical protein